MIRADPQGSGDVADSVRHAGQSLLYVAPPPVGCGPRGKGVRENVRGRAGGIRRFSKAAISRCAGASVLLYAVCPISREVHILLGKDTFGKQRWSDFGGGSEFEADYQCAARELCEETHGIFPDFTVDCLRALRKIVFEFPHARHPKHYTTFIGNVPFPAHEGELDAQFRRALAALPADAQQQAHVAEKAEIRMFRLSDIRAVALRGFFRMRLQHAAPRILSAWGAQRRTTVQLYGPGVCVQGGAADTFSDDAIPADDSIRVDVGGTNPHDDASDSCSAGHVRGPGRDDGASIAGDACDNPAWPAQTWHRQPAAAISRAIDWKLKAECYSSLSASRSRCMASVNAISISAASPVVVAGVDTHTLRDRRARNW